MWIDRGMNLVTKWLDMKTFVLVIYSSMRRFAYMQKMWLTLSENNEYLEDDPE